MPAKKPKLTKKMLSHLDKAEVRTICLVAMNVPPEQGYQVDTKWLIDHIYKNQQMFAEADLSDVPIKKWRNAKAYRYIRRLQGYLLGEEEAPTWPPHTDGVDDTNPQTEIMPEAPAATPVKVTKIVEAAPSQEDEVLEAVTTEKEAVEVWDTLLSDAEVADTAQAQSTIKFKKVAGFGKKTEEETAPEAQELRLLFETVETLSNAVEENHNEVSSAIVDFTEIHTVKFASIVHRLGKVENALLFIINSAILGDDQVVTSLEEVPKPPYN